MNFRYFVIAIVAVLVIGIIIQVIVITTLGPAQQAAMVTAGWIGSFWANVVTTGVVSILGARKAAATFTDPRYGRVVGTVSGAWVGAGALIGMALCGLFLNTVYNAQVLVGQVIVFGLILLFVGIVAGAITGRETAHPPEEEEA